MPIPVLFQRVCFLNVIIYGCHIPLSTVLEVDTP